MSDDIKSRIDAAIETVEARGISLEAGYWGVWSRDGEWTTSDLGSHKDRCCPLGALLLAEQPRPASDDEEPDVCAALALGRSYGWVAAFIEGFDGESDCREAEPEMVDAWKLGRSYRGKLG